jgi:hypothetical protein
MIEALPAVALALGLMAGAPAAAPAIELERVVAVVRPPAGSEVQVVTLGKLEEEARIALVSRGAVLAATGPLDGPALKAGLEWLIDQILLDAEATRLHVFDIDAAEAAAELARFKGQFDKPAEYREFLARSELLEPELEAILRRMFRVRRYVESRVSHAARVSEGDVSSWLDQHAAELGSRDRDAARTLLAQQRISEEVRALVRDVRSRAEVRVLEDLEHRPATPHPGTS